MPSTRRRSASTRPCHMDSTPPYPSAWAASSMFWQAGYTDPPSEMCGFRQRSMQASTTTGVCSKRSTKASIARVARALGEAGSAPEPRSNPCAPRLPPHPARNAVPRRALASRAAGPSRSTRKRAGWRLEPDGAAGGVPQDGGEVVLGDGVGPVAADGPGGGDAVEQVHGAALLAGDGTVGPVWSIAAVAGAASLAGVAPGWARCGRSSPRQARHLRRCGARRRQTSGVTTARPTSSPRSSAAYACATRDSG